MLKDLRTVAIFVAQEFIRHFMQRRRQSDRELLGVRPCIFTVDGAHGVHVLLNQFLRNVRDIGRMLDEPAQAVAADATAG